MIEIGRVEENKHGSDLYIYKDGDSIVINQDHDVIEITIEQVKKLAKILIEGA